MPSTVRAKRHRIDGADGYQRLDVLAPRCPIRLGTSGSFKKRRDQVKDSFSSVADKPTLKTWTLVVPGNPTTQELKSVLALKLRAERFCRMDGPS